MTVDTVQPVALVDHVRRYAADCAGASEPSEAVAATVVRVDGLSNRGLAGSGHRVDVDEPETFGGTGGAPDPAELLLIAVGASLSVTLTVHAALADVRLDSIEVALTGDLDPMRFLEPDPTPGGGFRGLDLIVTLDTDLAPGAAQALLDKAMLGSPVIRSLAVTPRAQLLLK